MKINEIFYSIQGEGNWSGMPNIFIRAAGCNLRCTFCDTKYAYNDGKEMNISEIVKEIQKYPCNYVCITGGEPLLQNEVHDLIGSLLKKNYKICIETNGSLNIEKLVNKKNLMISLDIKCPSSDMYKKMRLENIYLLTKKDQIKFVINDRTDYNYAKTLIRKYKPNCTIFMQSVWGSDTRELARWILEDGINAKISMQIHKIIWGDIRGV